MKVIKKALKFKCKFKEGIQKYRCIQTLEEPLVCESVCHPSLSNSATLWAVACQAPLAMGFSSKNPGVGCHFLLQEIFQSQESNPCFLKWQADSLSLSHLGSPIPAYKESKLLMRELDSGRAVLP